MIRVTTGNTPAEPDALKNSMCAWRKGLIGLPKEYITHHAGLAAQELHALVDRYGLTVHHSWSGDDGWLDGMKVIHAVVETRANRLIKLKWHDGGRNFMQQAKCGAGWVQLHEEDLR